MDIRLVRKWFSDTTTIGEMYINGELKYYTLEDKDRKLEIQGCVDKVPKKTCIGRGSYRVIIDWSNRYQRNMPHIMNVPCFDGIRIHVGNYEGDTEGCILIGIGMATNMVTESKKAFGEFFPMLQYALINGEDVWIDIV